ncbi:methionine biosynthesis protein MetW [Candidatus Sumerlaeota bacterium]|nr:methionine biosynthesis protein MetW [Candidatus Sumerlaeota bacterium]
MPHRAPNRIESYRWIVEHVAQGGRVLDIGCGDGELLALLAAERQVRGTGIELAEDLVVKAVQRGLSVHHGNVEEGLDHYGDETFDAVVLSLIIQEVGDPRPVLYETFRVGKRVIVVFPNFAHWRARWHLAVRGQAPQTSSLPYMWYESPNRHFFSVADWELFCSQEKWRVIDRGFLAQGRRIGFLPNLRAEVAMYLMESSRVPGSQVPGSGIPGSQISSARNDT